MTQHGHIEQDGPQAKLQVRVRFLELLLEMVRDQYRLWERGEAVCGVLDQLELERRIEQAIREAHVAYEAERRARARAR